MEWTNPNISNPTATDKDIEIAEFDLGDVTPYSCTMSYSTGKHNDIINFELKFCGDIA